MQGIFRARTQHDDFEGTIAADGMQGTGSVSQLLRKEGLIKQEDEVIGLELYHSHTNLTIRAFLRVDSVEIEEVPVRIVSLALTTDQFFSLFKRLSVVLTLKALDLTGRTYEAHDLWGS